MVDAFAAAIRERPAAAHRRAGRAAGAGDPRGRLAQPRQIGGAVRRRCEEPAMRLSCCRPSRGPRTWSPAAPA